MIDPTVQIFCVIKTNYSYYKEKNVDRGIKLSGTILKVV